MRRGRQSHRRAPPGDEGVDIAAAQLAAATRRLHDHRRGGRHLRGVTVGEWPPNVFSGQDATDQIPILRAIVTSDLHNLVFQRDYRIVPATTPVR